MNNLPYTKDSDSSCLTDSLDGDTSSYCADDAEGGALPVAGTGDNGEDGPDAYTGGQVIWAGDQEPACGSN